MLVTGVGSGAVACGISLSVENRTWLDDGSSVVQRIVASTSLARSTRTSEIAGGVVSAGATGTPSKRSSANPPHELSSP